MLNPARQPNEQSHRPHQCSPLSCAGDLCGDRWSHADRTDRQQSSALQPMRETIENVAGKLLNSIGAVAVCNGPPWADIVIVD